MRVLQLSTLTDSYDVSSQRLKNTIDCTTCKKSILLYPYGRNIVAMHVTKILYRYGGLMGEAIVNSTIDNVF